MQTIIKIKQGTPRKEEWRMAQPVDFELCEGEQIAVIGDNGSGKSMFTDIITGRHPLLHQQAKYNFAPSDKPFVSDNIKLVTFRDSYGESDATYFLQQRWNQQEIDPEMPMVNGQPIISLSSGELRKYQLNKALEAHPRVLIIDNPYIGLDTQARQLLTDTLEKVVKGGETQLILVVAKWKDIPHFITHTVRVEHGVVHPKEAFAVQSAADTPIPTRPFLSPEERQLDEKKALLLFNNVSIGYGGRIILHQLSWQVNRGERWALRGPNGSGKSTLLSLICADNPQGYAADIRLFGHQRGSGESIWEIKKHIGYVSPEMHRAYRHPLPALDIVASGMRDTMGLYGKVSAEEKEQCRHWMEVFGIETLAERQFLQLSSGEQRLVLLARTFVKEPDLLILDEPLHGLDETNSRRALEVIDNYCTKQDKTLIMVTHYDDELPSCIQYAMTLEKH